MAQIFDTDKGFGDQFSEFQLGDAHHDTLAGFQDFHQDAQKFVGMADDESSDDEDEMFFSDDVGLSSSPLIRALRGDPHPKAHHHGLHERQLVGAWRTLETPTWIPARQEVAAVHKIHKDLGLITIQFVLDQRRMMVPQAFVEPVINEPPPVQVRYLPKGAPTPTPEEAMRPYGAWSHSPQHLQGSQIPGLPTGPYPGASVAPTAPQFPEPERWPIAQNTAQALRNRSIPPQAIKNTYGTHFYTELYKNNFYRLKQRDDDGRHFYVPLQGGAYEQMPNGNLVPVERLKDGRIVPKVRAHDAEDSLFGHMARHMGVH